MNRILICALAAFGLTNCASILSGTTQEIVVNTNPPGANCVLNRLGSSIGRVDPTPGGVTIQKTKEDITIVCNIEGYQTATYLSNSGIQAATWGNISDNLNFDRAGYPGEYNAGSKLISVRRQRFLDRQAIKLKEGMAPLS